MHLSCKTNCTSKQVNITTAAETVRTAVVSNLHSSATPYCQLLDSSQGAPQTSRGTGLLSAQLLPSASLMPY